MKLKYILLIICFIVGLLIGSIARDTGDSLGWSPIQTTLFLALPAGASVGLLFAVGTLIAVLWEERKKQ